MNKMFGLHLEPRLTPIPNSVPQLLNKVAVTQKAGQPSPTDAFVGTTVHIATAIQRDMVQGADWTALLPGRIADSTIEDKGLAVRVFTTLPGGIVYNTQLAPHPPTSLADLFKPEWKGKIASNPYGASFELLSASDVWGEEKTLDFARKFSAQISGLIGCPDMERVASGEFVLFAMDCSGRNWVQFARQGAPLGFIVPSDFAAQRYYYMVIPKNAAHPNAGKLFVTFLLTSRGAAHSLEDRRLRSAHLPGFGHAQSDRGLRSDGREIPRVHAWLVGEASGSGSGAAQSRRHHHEAAMSGAAARLARKLRPPDVAGHRRQATAWSAATACGRVPALAALRRRSVAGHLPRRGARGECDHPCDTGDRDLAQLRDTGADGQEHYSIAHYAATFLDPFTYRVLLNTLGFAAVTLVVALGFGVPIAWLAERTDFPPRRCCSR